MNPIHVAQWIVGGIGVVFFAVGGFLFYYYAGASEWPLVEATVLETAISQGYDDDRTPTYTARVTHRYEAEGRAFEKTFSLNHNSYRREAAEKALAAYPDGGTFMVRVKPGSPSAYSLPDSGEEILGWIFGGVGLGLLFIAFLLNMLAKRVGPMKMGEKTWEKEISFGD